MGLETGAARGKKLGELTLPADPNRYTATVTDVSVRVTGR